MSTNSPADCKVAVMTSSHEFLNRSRFIGFTLVVDHLHEWPQKLLRQTGPEEARFEHGWDDEHRVVAKNCLVHGDWLKHAWVC